jgi:predicted enzyme related to lactoylglutathione lyase
MTGNICHVEIIGEDVRKASEFYGSLFGWKIDDSFGENYMLFNTGREPSGGLMTPRGNLPAGIILYVQVEDIDASLRKVGELGGSVVTERTEIPNVGWYGLFRDPNENLMGLFRSAGR